LAAELKVNPNTVARAFRELALEGFLESKRGEGSVISAAAKKQARSGLDGVRQGLEEAVRMARRGGLSWVHIEETVRRLKGGKS